MLEKILEKSLSGERLSYDEGLSILQSPNWGKIAEAGHAKRMQVNPLNNVTYTAFRIINYTNFCNVDCSFCSFKDDVESDRGYTLSLDEIREKAEDAARRGIDQIFFQGGVNPKLPLSYYTDAFQLLKEMGMEIRALSPVEILRLAEKESLSVNELLEILKASGLSSVPGAGAEILTPRMREILSPKKLSAEDWCYVMGEAHKLDLPGSSNIVFGSVETDEDIMDHLEIIRQQQDKTGGFLSFIPWTFQQQTKKFQTRHVKGWEYLRMVALCRLYLDNIPHLEVSVMVLGRQLAELGLWAGADDMSSIVIEENVLKSYGIRDFAGAEKFIQQAGFTPARRDMNYNPAAAFFK